LSSAGIACRHRKRGAIADPARKCAFPRPAVRSRSIPEPIRTGLSRSGRALPTPAGVIFVRRFLAANEIMDAVAASRWVSAPPVRAVITVVLPAVVLGLGLANQGCGSSASCDLDQLLRQRAGAGAADCGRVAVGAPTTATDQCIADQTARGMPFFARYDVQGIDSSISLGVVRDPRGQSSVLMRDSDPSGGGNVGAQIAVTVCGGDPPIQTPLTRPDGFPIVSCTVDVSSGLVCGG
jgi:hypothetical protein